METIAPDSQNLEHKLVDSWSLYNNTDNTTAIVENGEVIQNKLYNKILESCRKKIK